uniref:Aminopeptidase n=1 Tax=Denticeps clupeoides TaxID=299321 RepID=A0AAY4B5J4_9TELE
MAGSKVYISKTLAATTVLMTFSAIIGIITMIAVYQLEVMSLPPTKPPEPTTTETIPTGPPPSMRLPGNVIPESYKVFLQPYLYTEISNVTNQTFLFTGNSTVQLRCMEKSKNIFLHSKDLVLKAIRLTDLDENVNLEVTHHVNESDSDSNFLEIRVENEVLRENGSYSLFTAFEGILHDDLEGFYRSEYEDQASGEKRFLAASQMEPTDARKVFPCFDEPAMKAYFEITIIHREGTTALTNWPMTGKGQGLNRRAPSWLVTPFATTSKMSTYILAITVSDFTSQPSPHREGIKVWARPDAVDAKHTDYAATITVPILEYYEEEFGIKYPLNKLDEIALPDLGPGAMENWGLITYRESALLFVEGVSSETNKEWIATIIAHELAHQWFGNLVTMNWWNEIWLNEGFATYMAYKGVDKVEPSWNVKDLIVINEVQEALEVDALTTSHPLCSAEEDIQTPSDIAGLFDVITYSKGAAVLRMLSYYIGENQFKMGIRSYLNEFKYSNVVQKDLWRHLQQAVDDAHRLENVEDVMKSWTQQVGYPVVTVNTNDGKVYQEHFLLNKTDNSVTWQVPIITVKDGSTDKPITFLLTDEVTKSEFKSDRWVLANVNRTGFYRVNYNKENWQRDIIDLDFFMLIFSIRAKYVNVTLALDTTKYLKNDTEYIPWQSAVHNLDYFILMFDRSEVYGPMQAYLRKQVIPLYEYFENYTIHSEVPESHTAQYINAISVACANGFKNCTDMASSLFNRWRENDTYQIHPNLKTTIYCNAIAAGGEDEWEFAWERFQNSTVATERDKLRYALSCTKQIWLLNRYLQYTLDPNKIRKMDAVSTIIYIARNVAGQALAWDFVRAQWNYFSQQYDGGIIALGELIDEVTLRFSTEYELQQLKQFQAEHGEDSLGSASRALEQAIERTEANIKWVKENKRTVLEWFRRESKTAY